MTLRAAATVLGLCLVFGTQRAQADDSADEAELHFNLASAAYEQGRFELSLEHFLTSNRLVTNQNVVYNIARCFEQLGKYPEAYRYFDLALASETQPESVASIEQALQRIASKVAILSVQSDPPGATIYVERKNLGPRGLTPRRLGLPAGRYVVIAELPGYLPAQVETEPLALGQVRSVKLSLSPILGTLHVAGEPGTKATIGRTEDGNSCALPCDFLLRPGDHELRLTRPSHVAVSRTVEVSADHVTTISQTLERLSGSVVVSTDEPNALVEIDGIPRGFTPAVVTVPVGEHRVRVVLAGYRTVEKVVAVEPERQSRLALELVLAEQVEGASRRVESVEDSPSSVSIVSAAELKALAYPTIAESLRGLPGVFFWDDRGYVGIGMRGLGRLGSYGNRVLVLLDGVPMNDNWIGSAYVGHDLMTDLGDVERVELIRGPGSAVYGTSAFSGVVNVITRRANQTGVEAAVATATDGVATARARGNVIWGKHSNLFLSAQAARSEGRDYFFPEYRDGDVSVWNKTAQSGWSRGLDGMRTLTLQSRVEHGVVSAHGFWHRHTKDLPAAPFDTTFGDPRTRQQDERGFFELRFQPTIGKLTQTTTRVVFNRYLFRGTYARPTVVDDATGEVTEGLEIDEFRGHWLSLDQRLVHQLSPTWQVTVGGEGAYHFDVEQTARDARGYFLDQRGDDQKRYGVVAGYTVVDGTIGPRVRISLGGRVDYYSTFGASFNPRGGLVLKPYEGGNTKVTVGRAFRAPSIYELFYNDDGITQVESPDLSPETVIGGEIEHSHRLTPTILASASLYVNTVRGLIDQYGAGTSQDLIHYETSRNPMGAVGAEVGLRRDWRSGFMASIYYGYTATRLLRDGQAATFLRFEKEPGFRHVSNTPAHAATFKGAAPFLLRGMSLGTRVTFEDRRWDRFESAGEARQKQTAAAVLWDLVLRMADEKQRIAGSLGVYNLFDWQYAYPVGSEFSLLRTSPAAGRSLLLSVEARQ